MNLNERFNYYPEPNKEDGYAVVLKSSPAKFKSTENPVSDLVRASKLGLINDVKGFLDQGTDVNAINQDGYTALFTAVFWGQRAVVEMLLDRGARIDIKGPSPPGWTPLMCAISLRRLNDTGLAEELLRRGADVNARGDDGEAVLTLATKKGQGRIVEKLLRGGADLNVKDTSGRTALVIAEASGLKEIAALLKRFGSIK
jgi:ankyrin repeat protein